MKTLSSDFPLKVNKLLLKSLSKFNIPLFNDTKRETLFDDKINEFLTKVSN